MSQPSGPVSGDDIIPIETKYMYVTAMSVARENLLMTDVCAICKNSLGHPCVKCNSTLADCPVLIGACNHALHAHCSEEWVRTHGTCARCGARWQLQKTVNSS